MITILILGCTVTLRQCLCCMTGAPYDKWKDRNKSLECWNDENNQTGRYHIMKAYRDKTIYIYSRSLSRTHSNSHT